MNHLISHLIVLTSLAHALASPCFAENEDNLIQQSQRITKSYPTDQVANVVIDLKNGAVFFDAGADHYVWRPDVDNLAERIDAAFHLVTHLRTAVQVETGR